MSPRRSDARERMLASTVALVRERGASATSIDHVLAHSGAPRGSVYHHFPGGRTQLLEEAVAQLGDGMARLTAHAGSHGMLATFDAFIAAWRARLRDSDFTAGCPVLAVAIEHLEDAPALQQRAGEVFGAWRDALAAVAHAEGLTPARARSIATTVIAGVEGAVALARVERSLRPLDDVARELRGMIEGALA